MYELRIQINKIIPALENNTRWEGKAILVSLEEEILILQEYGITEKETLKKLLNSLLQN